VGVGVGVVVVGSASPLVAVCDWFELSVTTTTTLRWHNNWGLRDVARVPALHQRDRASTSNQA